MKIKHKFEFVEGNFDTQTGKLIAVCRDKYAEVELCFKENMNIPFAKIKLYSRDRFIDAKETMDDAYALATEIADRWNSNNKQSEKALKFAQKIAKIEPGSAPSVGYFQELIEEAQSIFLTMGI